MERYKNRIYHDCHINRQTKCRKRNRKNHRCNQSKKRICGRKRLHGYMDFREHAVTGHAEGLRNPEAGTE